jgi:cell wall-associated NlpC family hydrolase
MKQAASYSLLATGQQPEASSQELRARIVAIAREWIGTPHHHMARVKGAGVDCAMFPLEVYREAGVIGEIEIPFYPPDWMLHRSEEIFLGIVERYARELNAPAAPLPTARGSVQAGDFVIYRFGRCFSHGAIVTEWPTVIHAVNGPGVILSDGEREGVLVGRAKRFFSLWE